MDFKQANSGIIWINRKDIFLKIVEEVELEPNYSNCNYYKQ